MKVAPRGSVVGLEIGRHAVRAAWSDLRGAAPVGSRLESLRLPADGTDSAGVILPWLEQLKLGRTPCIVALCGDQCMFQPLRLQPNDPRSLKQAAEMEAAGGDPRRCLPESGYAPSRFSCFATRLLRFSRA